MVGDRMLGRPDTRTRETCAEQRTAFIIPFWMRRADRTGVRALIVAIRTQAISLNREKPGNAGGAKGCRKVETRCL